MTAPLSPFAPYGHARHLAAEQMHEHVDLTRMHLSHTLDLIEKGEPSASIEDYFRKAVLYLKAAHADLGDMKKREAK